MLGHQLAIAADRHLAGAGGDVDEASDHPWVDQVVTRVDAYVLITGQTDSVMQTHRRCHWWQLQHQQVLGVE